MSKYDEFASALARIRGETGGTREQCCASACLVAALFHYELTEFARALKREDFEAMVYEDVASISLRLNGARVTLQRFSGQSEIKLDFYGFDSHVVPPDQCEQRHEVKAMSREEAISAMDASMRAIEALWRQELAVRKGA